MISEFSPRIGPIPTSYALSSKNYFYNNLSVIAKGPEFTQMFCSQMRNLMQ